MASTTLRLVDGGTRLVMGENTAEAVRQKTLATEMAAAAMLSAATAEAAAGPNYASTAAGLSATTDGEAFAVDGGALYRARVRELIAAGRSYARIEDGRVIFKADVGIKDGRIAALGKAGNPDIADGIDPALEIGPTTDVIAGEGRILTAGGIDGHVHFICPQIVETAVAAGMTTLIGGGTGPSEGTRATTCTPSPGRRTRTPARCC